MLQIRPAQFDTFEQTAQKQFEDETAAHLLNFAPAHARGVGDEGLRKLVRLGLARARQYDFTLRGPVRFYIELMVMFGSDFDTDPLLPWAARHLRAGGRGELARADRLHEVSMAYKDRVIGPEYEFEAAAIRRLLRDPIPVWLAGDHSDIGVESRLQMLYPEKCEAAGTAAVRSIIARARHTVQAEGLPAATGGFVFAALMLAFGHGCASDPQFPWIGGNLRDNSGHSGEVRVEKLATRAVAYLSRGLAVIEQG